MSQAGLADILAPGSQLKESRARANSYLGYYGDGNGGENDKSSLRAEQSTSVANQYYNIATDFFEYGWGDSFHFYPLGGDTPSHQEALRRHEYKLAMKLAARPHHTVLDLGCGVGGPARRIASFTDASVVGLNYNDYQLHRAEQLTRQAALQHRCSYVKGDFCDAPFEDNKFDRAYAIEATCHASDLCRVYAEAFRTLKPGGLFGNYEWALTDKFDPNNTLHKKTKADVLVGNGLPDLVSTTHVLACLKKVGFEVLESCDLAATPSHRPWYTPLQPGWSRAGFRSTPLGRWLTHCLLVATETVGMAPRGSCTVHATLCTGADGLVAAGKLGIFTPMFFFLARKPDK